MNTRSLGRGIVIAVAASVAGLATAGDLAVTRVVAPASVNRGAATHDLKGPEAILPGDVVSAGSRGRVSLALGAGSITLFTMGDLQVFDAKGPKGMTPANGKLKLLAGAMRVDSRATRLGQAQDVRLNVGGIKSRIFGADAWAASTAEGDTLCVLAGTVEVQVAGEPTRRLDTPNTCLRTEPDGRPNVFAVADDPLVARTIAATTAPAEGEAAIIAAVPAAPAAPVTTPSPAAAPAPAKPKIIATPAPAGAPKPAATTAPGSGWTVVVLSLATRAPVETRTQELIGKGLPAVTRTAEVNGKTTHRVTVGSFTTQDEARAYAKGELKVRGLQGWVAPI